MGMFFSFLDHNLHCLASVGEASVNQLQFAAFKLKTFFPLSSQKRIEKFRRDSYCADCATRKVHLRLIIIG